MSYEVWADDLPRYPERGGLSRQPSDARVYEPTDSGPGMSRPESSAGPEVVNVPLIFTSDEMARFWRFRNEDLASVNTPFWFPAVGISEWAIAFDDGAVMTDDDDAPLVFDEWWLVMFRPDAEAPIFSPRTGDEWSATLPLWILMP